MVTLHFTRVPSLGLEVLHASNLTHAYPAHLHEHDSIGVLLRGERGVGGNPPALYQMRSSAGPFD